jgi:hypothetical protein
MMISWWSKYVGVILNVLMCDIWINVLLQTSALVGPLPVIATSLKISPFYWIRKRFTCSQEAILKAVLRDVNLFRTHNPTLILIYLNIILQYTHMQPKLCLSMMLSDKHFARISHLCMRDLAQLFFFHLISLLVFDEEQNLWLLPYPKYLYRCFISCLSDVQIVFLELHKCQNEHDDAPYRGGREAISDTLNY